MKTNRLLLAVLFCGAGLFVQRAHAENWPQWRGPFFTGSTTESNLPTGWSKTKNVIWVTPLPGLSHATPIIWGDTIFINSPDADRNLLLLCLDRATGKIRWQRQVSTGDRTIGMNNNMTSPSPLTDGKTVWTMYGTGDLAAFDFEGRLLWTRHLAKEYGKFTINWLYASSPMLYKDRLYVQVLERNLVPNQYSAAIDGRPNRESYILCLDPHTGTNIWKHVRPTDALGETQEAYSTAMPSECPDGTEIVVAGGDYVTGHDAQTGAELWRGGGLRNPRFLGTSPMVPSPLIAAGMVFVSGSKRNPFLAFHDCGHGDVTSNGLAWSYAMYSTDAATPLYYQGKVFMLDGDRQMMICFEPHSGHVVWQKPMGNREIYRASPTGADGKIYCLSESATAVVFSADTGDILSTVPMAEGPTHASIAASQECLFIRTAQTLYCIGNK
jgi:outer membrane protein assembly factor BamB